MLKQNLECLVAHDKPLAANPQLPTTFPIDILAKDGMNCFQDFGCIAEGT